QQLAERLPAELDGSRMEVTARIRGLPQPTDTGWRFEIEQVRSLEGLTLPLTRVHWFAGEAVNPGEHWRFELSLRRPAGMANPGGFDYEAWLYARASAPWAASAGENGWRSPSAPRRWFGCARPSGTSFRRCWPGSRAA